MRFIVFDLDQTVFNHARGEKDSLLEIYSIYFNETGVSFSEFYTTFSKFNKVSWQKFENGFQSVEEAIRNRFKLLCDFYKIERNFEDVLFQYSRLYVENCAPYSGVDTLLRSLVDMNFSLAVCSNGLERIQTDKLVYHDVKKYFSYLQYGSKYPYCKPHVTFFKSLIDNLNANPEEILFIGDSLIHDIIPAQKLGMKNLHVNGKYLNGDNLQCNLVLKQIKYLNGLP